MKLKSIIAILALAATVSVATAQDTKTKGKECTKTCCTTENKKDCKCDKKDGKCCTIDGKCDKACKAKCDKAKACDAKKDGTACCKKDKAKK